MCQMSTESCNFASFSSFPIWWERRFVVNKDRQKLVCKRKKI